MTIDSLKAFGANTAEGLARCMNNEAFYLRMVGMVFPLKLLRWSDRSWRNASRLLPCDRLRFSFLISLSARVNVDPGLISYNITLCSDRNEQPIIKILPKY